jgi:D-glycero-D-manno-heptose 1,7-bisphosphate phosphatase
MISALSAVFLDRDGTINAKAPDGEYVERPEDLALLDGAGAAIHRLTRFGVPVVVVTNQRGVAPGVMTLEDVARVHDRLRSLLRPFGATVLDFFVCPHDVATCTCRKPAPGLLFQARTAHPWMDLHRTVLIGDSPADVQAGRRAGTRCVRLAGIPDPLADATVPDLGQAVDWIVERAADPAPRRRFMAISNGPEF